MLTAYDASTQLVDDAKMAKIAKEYGWSAYEDRHCEIGTTLDEAPTTLNR